MKIVKSEKETLFLERNAETEKFHEGSHFVVPNVYRGNHKYMRFDGLHVEKIELNEENVVLGFNHEKWYRNITSG